MSTIKDELIYSIKELRDHGLRLSTRWISEQLYGLNKDKTYETDNLTLINNNNNNNNNFDDSAFFFALSLIEGNEYQRATWVLQEERRKRRRKYGRGTLDVQIEGIETDLTLKEVFLMGYSLYLAGEQRKEEEILESSDPISRKLIQNAALSTLHIELKAMEKRNTMDSFCLYLLGMIEKELLAYQDNGATQTNIAETGTFDNNLKFIENENYNININNNNNNNINTNVISTSQNLELRNSAINILCKSILLFPWNWSAWLDLAELCIGSKFRNEPPLNKNSNFYKIITKKCLYMYQFFLSHLYIEEQKGNEALEILMSLLDIFPTSQYIKSKIATAHFIIRDNDSAEEIFLQIRKNDPFRLDEIDIYSNILYVTMNRAALSHLAHSSQKTSKYSPQTCCVIGNYYSLKGDHERAVTYFQRALRLDRKYTSAWTLMGHELLELRNPKAAIESYRRALDTQQRDYRAWYGLAQAYEILQMYYYALYYYRKAVILRPFDYRIWCAIGLCFEKIENIDEAIMSYQRAINIDDREGISTIRLANLYQQQDEIDLAAEYYQKHVDTIDIDESNTSMFSQETIDAIIFLIKYYKERNELQLASKYCFAMINHLGPESGEAKSLLREIRLMENNTNNNNNNNNNSLHLDDLSNDLDLDFNPNSNDSIDIDSDDIHNNTNNSISNNNSDNSFIFSP